MVIIAKAMKIANLNAKLTAHTTEETLLPFKDVTDVSSWALSGIANCVQLGIVSGRKAAELAPKAPIT